MHSPFLIKKLQAKVL